MTSSTNYIGSKISLVSKSELRYEGTLFSIDPNQATITLQHVKMFGTEDRKADIAVPPRDDIYEYIIFKANDIKDILVNDMVQQNYGFYDPAIVDVKKHAATDRPNILTSPGQPSAAHPNFQAPVLSSDLSTGHKHDSRLSSPPLSPANPQFQNKAPGAGRRESASQMHNHQQQQQPRFQGHHQNNRGNYYSHVGAATAVQHAPGQQQRPVSRRDDDVESVEEARSRASFQSRDANNYRNRGNYRGSQIGFAGHRGGGRGGGAPTYVGDSYRDRAAANLSIKFPSTQQNYGGGGGAHQTQQQNFAGPQRGGRGRGAFSYNHFEQHHRRGGAWAPKGSQMGNNGGFVPRGSLSRGGGRGGGAVRYDSDYDFEKANEQFIETMNDLKDEFTSKVKLSENKENVDNVNVEKTSDDQNTAPNGSSEADDKEKPAYDKQKSFFDHISCEALEILEGVNGNRANWRRERELNQETFGQVGLHRNFAYRRGGRGQGGGGRGQGGYPRRIYH